MSKAHRDKRWLCVCVQSSMGKRKHATANLPKIHFDVSGHAENMWFTASWPQWGWFNFHFGTMFQPNGLCWILLNLIKKRLTTWRCRSWGVIEGGTVRKWFIITIKPPYNMSRFSELEEQNTENNQTLLRTFFHTSIYVFSSELIRSRNNHWHQ